MKRKPRGTGKMTVGRDASLRINALESKYNDLAHCLAVLDHTVRKQSLIITEQQQEIVRVRAEIRAALQAPPDRSGGVLDWTIVDFCRQHRLPPGLARQCKSQLGAIYVRDLVKHTYDDVYAFKNIGKMTMYRLVEHLAKHGLRLADQFLPDAPKEG